MAITSYVYGELLRAAGSPYVETLRQWTRTGNLLDPYEEFCVKEKSVHQPRDTRNGLHG